MLVLTRKSSERVIIGDDISITIVRIGPHYVRIGIEAPKDVKILRDELKCDSEREPEESSEDDVDDQYQRFVREML